MIPLRENSDHRELLRLTPRRSQRRFRLAYMAPLQKATGSVLVGALFIMIPATYLLAQSEPSLQPPPSSTAGPATVTSAVNLSPEEAPPEYRVGPGDVLAVTVYNMPELNRTTVVGSNGALILSYFPQSINVKGETAQQVGDVLAAELKHLQMLLDPQVSVGVIKVGSKPVVVGGDVRSPQVLEEIRPFTLQEALMLVGGPQPDAGTTVLVTRSNPSDPVTYDLQLSKVMAGTDPNSNIPIMPGDSIQVLPGQKVFVAGAVQRPGAFDLTGDQSLTIAKLMALSGGWKPDSKPAKAVIVRQSANSGRQTIPVNLQKIMARKEHDVALEANDLLYVPGDTGKAVGLAAVKGVSEAAMYAVGFLIVGY